MVGLEVMQRIIAAAGHWNFIPVHGDLLQKNVGAIFGVVASVARLGGLTLDETVNAMGVAKSMTQQNDMAMYRPTTLTVRMHHGFLAQDAITICELARRGVTGPRQVLLGKYGFLYHISRGQWPTEADHLTADLGSDWFQMRTSHKPFSACGLTHAAATALMTAMSEHSVSVNEIAGIYAEVSKNTWPLCCVPKEEKWDPQSDESAQFSLPYVLSVIAHEGRFCVDEFKAASRERTDIRSLMSLVSASVDNGLGPFEARVTLTLSDGRRIAAVCSDVPGSPTLRFTDEQWKDRFACSPNTMFPVQSRERLSKSFLLSLILTDRPMLSVTYSLL